MASRNDGSKIDWAAILPQLEVLEPGPDKPNKRFTFFKFPAHFVPPRLPQLDCCNGTNAGPSGDYLNCATSSGSVLRKERREDDNSIIIDEDIWMEEGNNDGDFDDDKTIVGDLLFDEKRNLLPTQQQQPVRMR